MLHSALLPINSNDAVSKSYVDAVAQGLNINAPVATRAALPSSAQHGDAIYVADEEALYVWQGPPEPSPVDAIAAIDKGADDYKKLHGRWVTMNAHFPPTDPC